MSQDQQDQALARLASQVEGLAGELWAEIGELKQELDQLRAIEGLHSGAMGLVASAGPGTATVLTGSTSYQTIADVDLVVPYDDCILAIWAHGEIQCTAGASYPQDQYFRLYRDSTIVDTSMGQVRGTWARWNSPHLGYIGPGLSAATYTFSVQWAKANANNTVGSTTYSKIFAMAFK